MGVKVTTSALVVNRSLTAGVQKGANQAAFQAGLSVERVAKQLVSGPSPGAAGQPPGVISGELRNSIQTQRDGDSVVVGPTVFYGKFQEFGTRLMSAHPFMRPALLKAQKLFASLFRGLI